MKSNRKTKLLIIAVLVLTTLLLSSCLGFLFNVADGILNKIGEMLDAGVDGFDDPDLPENVKYGTENLLAIGLRKGELVAFWDDTVTKYCVRIIKNGETNDFTPDTHPALFFAGGINLAQAGYSYADDFRVTLYTGAGNEIAVGASYLYNGIEKKYYDKYKEDVEGGFVNFDAYIATRYELFEMFSYLLIFRPSAEKGVESGRSNWILSKDIYIGYDIQSYYDSGTSYASALAGEISCAINAYEDSAAYRYGYSAYDNKECTLNLKFLYDVYPDKISTTNTLYANIPPSSVHYSIASEENERHFPIDDRENALSVSSGDQLYYAIKKGYRPLPKAGSPAEALYAEMRRILSILFTDSTSDVTVAHHLYDYIVNTVVYDYDYTDVLLNDKSINDETFFLYKCLYLEGVFGMKNNRTFSSLERVAICDGLSKAYLCLLQIEGLDAIKVSGKVSGGAHAWNKVKLEDKWYMVDTTWGNERKSNNYYEYLSHDYLLTADKTTHKEDPWFTYPKAATDYPQFIWT